MPMQIAKDTQCGNGVWQCGNKILEKGIRIVLCALMAGMVAINFANVVSRYYLNASLAWSEEISRFLLIWTVFLGAILAYAKDEHLSLDMVVSFLSPERRRVFAMIVDILVMLAMLFIIKGGYSLTADNFDWTSPAAEIPYGWVYIVVPFSGLVMFLQAAFKLFCHIKGETLPGGGSC
jgi:TRAP-type C4-dicarboxylate transport system permease small subunit